MPRTKHIINIHTSTGTSEPLNANLLLGEIAVQHTPDNPALWIKMGTSEESTDYEKFIGENEIYEILATSAASLQDLAILSAAVVTISGETGGGADVAPLSAAVISLSAGVKDNEYVAAAAINYLNDRINELSGNTGGGADVQPLSGAVLSLSAAVVTISGNSGSGGDIQPLSSATSSHISNNNIHVTSADKTVWTNGANSGASAYTAVTELSAATVAHEGNANVHVPTGGTEGQILSVVNGNPAWTNPLTVYTGTLPPEQTLGIPGDLYIRTDN